MLAVGLGLGTILVLRSNGRRKRGTRLMAQIRRVERRSGIERRVSPDRRQRQRDDVVGRIARFTDRRSGIERRSGQDRRTTVLVA
jgi:hypothetical protein